MSKKKTRRVFNAYVAEYLESRRLLSGATFVAATPATVAVGSDPYSVISGDFSGDGKADLAVANEGSNTVSILLGNGNGTFAAATSVAVGSVPVSVITGDFNGDGKTDLATANINTSTVSILLGNGNGTFTAAAPVAVGTSPESVIPGDFNGDGKTDLATANSGSNTVSILLNTTTVVGGTATFAAATSVAVGNSPASVISGDFNGDGKADLATSNANSSGTVSILLGNGNGTFAAATSVAVGSIPVSVISGDFNGDGKADLATANFSSNRVSILLGNGNGTFAAATSVAVGSNPESVISGDFNGDGKADLATANFSSNTVSILLGNGNGTFAAATSVAVGSNPYSMISGDFNGDGKADLATANLGSNTVSILLNTTPISSFHTAANTSAGSGPHGVTTADFDGNGILDVADVNYGGTVSIFKGSSAGVLSAWGSASSVGFQSYGIVAGNFNGDGKPDLAVANGGSGTVSILLNLNNGNTATSPFPSSANSTITVGSSPYRIYAADLNNDGILDLVTANVGGNNVSVMFGNGASGVGNGTFATAVAYSTGSGSGPGDLAIGDFNGDGYADLATADSNSNQISILLNKGVTNKGVFNTAVTYATGASPNSIAAADFNGDGKLDLAAGNENSNNITLFQGSGTGTFISVGTVGTASDLRALTAVDLDKDGKIDLVYVNGSANTIGTLYGNGGFGFVQGFGLPVGALPVALATGDLNGDGEPDLVTANFSDNNISALLSGATQTFVTSSSANSVYGQSVTFTATIAPSAGSETGTVQFMIDGSNVGTETALSGHTATYSTSTLALGSHTIVAVYSGDTNFAGSTSATFTQTVAKAGTTTSVTSSGANSTPGQSVTFTATVAPSSGSQSGTVQFMIDGSNVGSAVTLSGHTATYSTSTLTNGSHMVVAVYNGDPNYAGSTSTTFTQTIAQAATTTTMSSSGSVTTPGQSVTFTATVLPSFGSQTGTIHFMIDGSNVGTPVTLSGHSAIYSTSTLTLGNHMVVAVYSGDTSYTSSNSATVTQYVFAFSTLFAPANPPTVTAGSNSTGIVSADFNNDGNKDLAVLNPGSNTVSVLLGTGYGSFGAANSFAVGSNPGSISLGDFNGDGKVDLATAGTNNNGAIAVLLNTTIAGAAVASFAPMMTVQSDRNSFYAITGDFNNDGKTDLVTPDISLDGISILLSNGDGTFKSPQYYATTSMASGANYVISGDFNGDGKLDLAVPEQNPFSPGVSILLGKGDGTFQTRIIDAVPAEPAAVISADFNGDGKSDLAVDYLKNGFFTSFDSNVDILLSNGDGTFRAPTISGMPTGGLISGDFNGDGKADLMGSGLVMQLGNGDGTFATPTIIPSSSAYSITSADFNGDGKPDLAISSGSSSGAVSILLKTTPKTTSTTVSSSGPSAYGQPVTLTATITPVNGSGETGTVQFMDGSATLGSPVTLSGNTATLTTTALSVGGHFITAVYSGDTSFTTSTSAAFTQSVAQVATTSAVTSSASPSSYGQSVTFTATVTPASGSGETGTITFKDGTTVLGTASINGSGVATLPTSALSVGSHSITAVYSGDTNFSTSTSPIFTQSVSQITTTTAVTSSNGSSNYGDSVTFTATITPASGSGEGGTLQFFDDGTAISGQVSVSGNTASFSTSALTAGSHAITAVYSGDSNFAGGTSSAFTETINKDGTTTVVTGSVNPQTTGQPVTFTATITPANGLSGETGSIQFVIDGSNVGSAVTVSTGTATYTTSSLTVGSHSVVASYNGNGNFAGSTSTTYSETINSQSTTTTVTSSNASSVYGQSVTFTATIAPASNESGTVQFMIDGNNVGNPVTVSNRTATYSTSALNAGSHTIIAVYSGDSAFATSTSSGFSQSVAKAATTTTGRSNANPAPVVGQSVILNASIAPISIETGTVQFMIDGVNVGTPVNFSGPSVSYTISSLTAGSHTIVAIYSGDTNFAGSTSASFTLNVTPTSPNFPSATSVAVGPGPGSVTSGDFNGDGKLDLATANDLTSGDGTVSIQLGNGDGTFGAATTYSVGTGPASVVSRDFNGDGELDLATANLHSNNVSILLGNGDGTFAAATSVTVAANPSSIISSDLNGDGKLDLITVNEGGTLSILLANGDGTFQPATTVAAGVNPETVVSADFNGDGKPDLAVSNENTSGAVSILLGNGDGTFQAATTVAVGSRSRGLVSADFNGDGKADLAITNFISNGTVSILLGIGDGTFTIEPAIAVGSDPIAIVSGDFNGDGNVDLATANDISYNVSILLGNGNGIFVAATGFAVGVNPFSIIKGDFNGDGRPDLVTSNFGETTDSIALNQSTYDPYAYNSGGTLTVSDTGGTSTISESGGVITVSSPGGSSNFDSASVTSIVLAGTTGADTFNLSGVIDKPIAIAGSDGGADTLNVNSGSMIASSDLGSGDSNLSVIVASGASAAFSSTQHLASLTVNGAVTMTSNGNHVLDVTGLTEGSGGKIDLANNSLIWNYTGTSPVPGLLADLNNGRDNGAWDGGSGIISSAVAGTAGSTIGYAEASSLFSTFPATFAGLQIDSTTLIATFTFTADATLDRTVNSADFGALAANYGKTSGVGFAQGDFNADGTVNALDFNALATQYGSHLPAPTGSASPENLPASVAAPSFAAPPTSLFADKPIAANDLLTDDPGTM